MSDNLGGIHQLHERRARRTRQAPQPRHPKLGAAEALDQPLTAQDGRSDTTTTTAATPPAPTPSPPPAEPQATAPAESQPAAESHDRATAENDAIEDVSHDKADSDPGAMPTLDIDPDDPTAHIVSPTVLSIPASIVKRFERARAHAPSHTALVLDALRAHAQELPTLILNRRPGPKPGDLCPFREAPGRTSQDTPLPVRIRPTKGELAVMKTLTDWASARIAKQRPGTRETNRSEMVAAALDVFLPPLKKTSP